MEKKDMKEVPEKQEESRWTKPTLWLCSLHLFTLCSLAFAKPIFDVTARDAAFFVVRGSRPVDIVSLVIILSVAIPAALTMVEGIFRLCGRKVQFALHFVAVGALVSVYAAPYVKHLKVVDGVPAISVILALGLCAALLYVTTQSFRRLLSLASPLILILPAFFVFGSQVGQIILPAKFPWARDNSKVQQVYLKNKPPIIFVQLDELPIVSLLDAKGNIDAKRFPNLAEFAKTANWFRFTTTVSGQTTSAIPAILTGISPQKKLLPNVTDHPNNLFTLLSRHYRFNVHELATYLCPEELSSRYRETPPFQQRISSLLSDLTVVFLHVVLPDSYTRRLPLITNQWGNFGKAIPAAQTTRPQDKAKIPTEEELVKRIYSHLEEDRATYFHKFVASISGEKETLNFIHLLLPHNPMEYLPSGKKHSTYTEVEGVSRIDDKFVGPQGLVDQYHYRHLLQLAYLDRMLGELIDKLKKSNMFDDSLIVFLADHGASFTSNDCNRNLTDSNVGDLAFVPLLIKVPGQKKGVVSDVEATTVDVLPTIADVLGTTLPWQTSGTSLLNVKHPTAPTRPFLSEDGKVHLFEYKKLLQMREKALARNVSLFGLSDPGSTLFWFGKYRRLMGRSAIEIDTVPGSFQVQSDQVKLFDFIDMKSNFIPAKISGKVSVGISGKSNPVVAISINGIIQGVAETQFARKELIFSTVIPEDAFRQGKNDIRFYLVSTKANGEQYLVSSDNKLNYTLKADHILTTSGKRLPIVVQGLQGRVDDISADRTDGNNVRIAGWAANAEKSKPVDAVLVFANGKFFNAYRTTILRPDIAKSFRAKELQLSGFKDLIPAKLIPNLRNIRVFAISGEIASELGYKPSLGISPDYVKRLPLNEPSYRLNGQAITSPAGEMIQVGPVKVTALVDVITKKGADVTIAGWAANTEKGKPVDSILIFNGDKFIASGATRVFRRDVKVDKANRSEYLGFEYLLTASRLGKLEDLRLFAVSDGYATELVLPIKSQLNGSKYALGDEALLSSGGEEINVYPNSLYGGLEVVKIDKKKVVLAGWAADVKKGVPVESLAIFRGEEFVGSGKPTINRPDVGKSFNNANLSKCGFNFSLPTKVRDAKKLRVFAISRGVAIELQNPAAATDGTDKPSGPGYKLEDDKIVTTDGTSLAIASAGMQTSWDTLTKKGEVLFISGWAADVQQSKVAERIVVFANGTLVASARPRAARPDVTTALSNDKIEYCGFTLSFPAKNIGDLEKIRVFALHDGVATELPNSAAIAVHRTKPTPPAGKPVFTTTTTGSRPQPQVLDER